MYLFQRRYQCSNCQWNPKAMNPDVLKQLPQEAQLSYGFLLSKRSGISLDLLEEFPALVDLGVGPSGIFQLIREKVTKKYVLLLILLAHHHFLGIPKTVSVIILQ